MKVIYHDKSGRHLAIIASAIHLQLIDQPIVESELQHLPNFLHTKPVGTLIYMGLDAQGNEIYTLGRGNVFRIIRNAYLGMDRAFQLNQDMVFVDVEPLESWSLKIFDLINRNTQNPLRVSGLMYQGIAKVIPKLQGLIQEVRKKTNKGE